MSSLKNSITTISPPPPPIVNPHSLMAEHQFDYTNMTAELANLKLGKIRVVNIPNSNKVAHSATIFVPNKNRTVFNSPTFKSPGLFVNDTDINGNPLSVASQNRATIMLTRDEAVWFEEFLTQLWNQLYPKLLIAIRDFEGMESAENRGLPPFLKRVVDGGIENKQLFLKPFWSHKEVTYVKIHGDALIVSKTPNESSVIEKNTVQDHIDKKTLPRRGLYCGRIQLNYVYLGPARSDEMKISLSMQFDQLLYSPEIMTAPTEILLNADLFFKTASNVFLDINPLPIQTLPNVKASVPMLPHPSLLREQATVSAPMLPHPSLLHEQATSGDDIQITGETRQKSAKQLPKKLQRQLGLVEIKPAPPPKKRPPPVSGKPSSMAKQQKMVMSDASDLDELLASFEDQD